MNKILVTGGAGYVGSHCVKALVDEGYECIVYDNLSRGNKDFVKWTPLIIGDIRDGEMLEKIFKRYKFDAVVHFAAFAYVGESVNNPLLYWDNNFDGTKQLLNTMLMHKVDKLVFSSTCAVYGQPDKMPISELTPLSPINPYGYSKLACENLMDQVDIAHGFKSVRFRYFNAGGSDFMSGLGEIHDPETHLIPLIIEGVLGKRQPVNIFGTDFPTPDGSAIRDYIHVKDLATAHISGLKYLLDGGGTNFFNLGTGVGNSVLDVVKTIEHHMQKPSNFIIAERRVGDPSILVANAEKALQILGWKPRHALDDIISDAINWHLKL